MKNKRNGTVIDKNMSFKSLFLQNTSRMSFFTKRLVSLLLAIILIFLVSLTTFASAPKVDDSPIIILSGYSAMPLYLNYGEADQKQVWGLDMDEIGDKISSILPSLAVGLIKGLFFNNYSTFVKVLGSAAYDILDVIAINPDSTSRYNVSYYGGGVANTSLGALRESGREEFIQLIEFVNEFEKNVDEDNIFFFFNDWRQGMVNTAAHLDEFIQEVKKLTGYDQVRLFGSSHGGQEIAAYLSFYADKKDVSKAVLEFPAIGGTSMVTAFLGRENFVFNIETFTRFFQAGERVEWEINMLTQLLSVAFLYEPLLDIVHEELLDIVLYFGSVWDLIPLSEYDYYKELYLDNEANAKLIADSDKFHYEALANMAENLEYARSLGTEVFIVANYGNQNVFSNNMHISDGILDTSYTSGATCPLLGEHFAPDYTTVKTVCDDNTHSHLSPGRDVDASSAYLPEHTWFVQGQFHGQSAWDTYTFDLTARLVLTDDIKDIYTSKDYPQFSTAQSPTDNISIKFSDSGYGFLNRNDSTLYITNLSQKYDMRLISVAQPGARVIYKTPVGVTVAPGETIAVPIKGILTFKTNEYLPLKVCFTQIENNIPILRTKTFDVTVNPRKM